MPGPEQRGSGAGQKDCVVLGGLFKAAVLGPLRLRAPLDRPTVPSENASFLVFI